MKLHIFPLLLILLFLSACNGTFDVGIEHSSTDTAPLATIANGTPISETIAAPTNTIIAGPTILIPSATPAPTNTPMVAATNTSTPNSTDTNYVDDRSSPSQVIVSLYNAINRQEYLRAYNYWGNPASSLGDFTTYAKGYATTASVGLVFGQITGDAGAGQYYFTVPVILKTTSKDATHTNYAACYVVHQSNPANYGEPPFNPMSINQGVAKQTALNANDATSLATACDGLPTGGNLIAISGSNLNIDKSNFLDNRSGPIETVSSLLNALNLKQYVRAYSYFQTPDTFPGPFDPYAAGYSDTDSIAVTFGTVQSEGAAGSLYYKVPLALKVLTTSAARQTFVGCYTLRLPQPAIQATPPFQPLGIISGKFTQIPNVTDVTPLLPAACN